MAEFRGVNIANLGPGFQVGRIFLAVELALTGRIIVGFEVIHLTNQELFKHPFLNKHKNALENAQS